MEVSVTDEAHDTNSDKRTDQLDEEEVMLPGFRFHPTDEELVGFYLRRKVDNKPIKVELIKQIDIYKYDPWDLPEKNGSKSSSVVEKEWFFFCIRGRKYRNSIRPNRVTGSGFWKATGIDKPIYSGGERQECIGLKKSLVYYRGSAGKGTKTDWMMHEFRHPPNCSKSTIHAQPVIANSTIQEAEEWTICRIFKRIPSFKKYTPNLKSIAAMAEKSEPSDSSSKLCSSESDNIKPQLMDLNDSSALVQKFGSKPVTDQYDSWDVQRNHFVMTPLSSIAQPQFPACYGYSSFWSPAIDHDEFANGSWDELRSVVQLATDPSSSCACP